MPRKKYYENIDDIELTHVQSGDQDNNVYYSYFSSNAEKKKQVLDTLLTKGAINDLIDSIFSGDISDDRLRRITSALTFYDAVVELTKNSTRVTASDLFFATLVNWSVSRGNGTNRIRSYSALVMAHDGRADALDYREYIVNGEGEGKFNNDYKAITISPKGYGNKMIVHLPIIPMKFGLFRLATERVAGYMTVIGDTDNTQHTIPAYLWLEMVSESMSRRITTKFSNFESKNMYKLIDADHKYIDEILAINDFHSVFNFMNTYTLEFDDNGEMTLLNTEEPPELEDVNGFEWVPTRTGYYLKSPQFYIAATHASAVHILAQR